MSATSPLLPRYRRPLTFGALLDETFQVYRRSWLTMVAISALWAFPYFLLSFLGGAAISRDLVASAPVTSPRDPTAAFALAGRALAYSVPLSAISMLFVLLGYGAGTATTDSIMRGARCSAWRAYAIGFGRLLPFVGAIIAWFLALALFSVLAIPLFVLGVFGSLGGLIALVGLIVWAASPGARRPWLKWLIILASPFGLPIYFSVRWSLYGQAVVLEQAGPIAALRRSGELVRGHWFRVLGVTAMISLIAGILQSIPAFVVGLIVGITAGPTSQIHLQTSLGVEIATRAATLIGATLFGAIWFILATLLFVDLRNRHEGADLAERLEQLEAGVPTAA